MGAARLYDATGEERYRSIAAHFWDIVVHDHSYVIGGNSSQEFFGPPGEIVSRLSRTPARTATPTTCSSSAAASSCTTRTGPRTWTTTNGPCYSQLLGEQDPDSAHGYVTYYTGLWARIAAAAQGAGSAPRPAAAAATTTTSPATTAPAGAHASSPAPSTSGRRGRDAPPPCTSACSSRRSAVAGHWRDAARQTGGGPDTDAPVRITVTRERSPLPAQGARPRLARRRRPAPAAASDGQRARRRHVRRRAGHVPDPRPALVRRRHRRAHLPPHPGRGDPPPTTRTCGPSPTGRWSSPGRTAPSRHPRSPPSTATPYGKSPRQNRVHRGAGRRHRDLPAAASTQIHHQHYNVYFATPPRPGRPRETARYLLAEGAGTAVADGAKPPDGLLSGGAGWTTGRGGRTAAVALGGTGGHVALPPGLITGLTELTVSAWVRVDADQLGPRLRPRLPQGDLPLPQPSAPEPGGPAPP